MNVIEYMKKAHEGQMYGEVEYWYHPIEVANTLEYPTEIQWKAAILHDVLEDTEATYEEIESLFGRRVADLVDGMSKPNGVKYFDYINAMAEFGDRDLILIKIADNQVNLRHSMAGGMLTNKSRIKKYLKSLGILLDALQRINQSHK